ncbi:MAG TPA: phosphodiester glycosidase family protein [Niabella sp.]|nr:phosphodiester glycosidase family protein [Niabella sp.]
MAKISMKHKRVRWSHFYVRTAAVFLFFCHAVCGYSQHTDSAAFVNAAWTVTRIAKGVKLYRYSFAGIGLFDTTENISYIKTRRTLFCRPEFSIAADAQTLYKTSDFAQKNKALAAVNGNFFDIKNGGAVDFTKVDGTIINVNRKGKSEKLDFHQKAAVVIDKGKLSIKKWDGLVNWEEWLTEPDVMLNGPLLLFNGEEEKLDSGSFNINRHPRTVVGVTKKGTVIMLVVDGRSPNSAGMNLFELTKVMRWLGCVSAINFDGGGSSALWVKDRGIINYPSDNKKWDHEGERKVANILYLKRRR